MKQTFLRIMVIVVAALFPSRGGIAQQNQPTPNIAMSAYQLDVTLDFSKGGEEYPFLNEMVGRARLTFLNRGDQALTKIPVLLNRLMTVTEARDAEGNNLVSDSTLVGIQGWESFQVNHTQVRLAKPLEPSQSMTLDITYGGQMAASRESGMAYVQETLDPAFSIFRIETFAYPVINLPDAQGKSPLAMSSAFSQRITINMPEGHDIATGGSRLLDKVQHGRRTVTVEITTPSDVMVFAVAPYQTIQVEDVQFYFFQSDQEGAQRLSTAAGEALELLADWFGPRQSSPEGIAFVEIPPGYGSQAIFPTIIQTAAAYRDPARTFEMFHEVAHLWNVRDLDTPSPRWNEGLSTFLQYLVDDRLREPGAYESGTEATFQTAKRLVGDDANCVGIREFGDSTVMRGQSYILGGLFFSRLYNRFGADFIEAYGAFYQSYKAQGATSRELTDFLEQRLGTEAARETRTWFDSCDYLDQIRGAEKFSDFLAVALSN